MGFWGWLFGSAKPIRISIDWLEVETEQRRIDQLRHQGNQLAYKQAVIDYDKLIDSILTKLSAGSTFAERLKALRSSFSNRDSYNHLWKAHIKRNELVHERGSFIADWEVDSLMRTYQETVSILRGISLG